MTFYPEYITENVPADLVIETPTGVYVGWYDRKNLQRGQDAPSPEEQPVWKIKYCEITQNGDNTFTRTLYPDGITDYCHVMENYNKYEYCYKN